MKLASPRTVEELHQVHPLLVLAHRYRMIHTVIGIAGNTLFLVGSLTFMFGPRTPAMLLFVAGSAGMLIGALGSAFVQWYRDSQSQSDGDG